MPLSCIPYPWFLFLVGHMAKAERRRVLSLGSKYLIFIKPTAVLFIETAKDTNAQRSNTNFNTVRQSEQGRVRPTTSISSAQDPVPSPYLALPF